MKTGKRHGFIKKGFSVLIAVVISFMGVPAVAFADEAGGGAEATSAAAATQPDENAAEGNIVTTLASSDATEGDGTDIGADDSFQQATSSDDNATESGQDATDASTGGTGTLEAGDGTESSHEGDASYSEESAAGNVTAGEEADTTADGVAVMSSSSAKAETTLQDLTINATGYYDPSIETSTDQVTLYSSAPDSSETFTATYKASDGYSWAWGWYDGRHNFNVEVTEVDENGNELATPTGLIDITNDAMTDGDGAVSITIGNNGVSGNTWVKVTLSGGPNSYYFPTASKIIPITIADSPNYVTDVNLIKDGSALSGTIDLYAFADPLNQSSTYQTSETYEISYTGTDASNPVTPGADVTLSVADSSIASATLEGSTIVAKGLSEGTTTLTVTATPKIPDPEGAADQTIVKTYDISVSGLTPPTPSAATSQLTFRATDEGWQNDAFITYDTADNADNEAMRQWLLDTQGSTASEDPDTGFVSWSLWWKFIASVESEDPEVFDVEPISTNWWSAWKFTTNTPGYTNIVVTDIWGQTVRIPVVVTAVEDFPVPSFKQNEYSIEIGSEITDVADKWMTSSVYHYDSLITSNTAQVYIAVEDEDGTILETTNLKRNDAITTEDGSAATNHSAELDGLVGNAQYAGIKANGFGYVRVYAYYLHPNEPYNPYPVVLDSCWVSVIDEEVPVESIDIKAADENGGATLDPDTQMNVGGVQNLRAVIHPDNATGSTEWESSDTSVLTIDSTGTLTAVGEGQATITAWALDGQGQRLESGVKQQLTIDVTNAVRKVEIVPASGEQDNLEPLKLDYDAGGYKLAGKVYPAEAVNNPRFNWTVEDLEGSNVLSVRQDGMIYVLNYGKARVTMELAGTGITDSIDVVVMDINPTQSVSINSGYSQTMQAGDEPETQTFQATLSPVDSTDAVRWSSSNENVLEIDSETGAATAKGPGTATVTATVVDEDGVARDPVITDSVDITVESHLDSLTMDTERTLYLRSGSWQPSEQLKFTVKPSNAEGVSYSWSSSDPSIVSVSGWGSNLYIAPKAVGSADVTVTATDSYGGTKTATCHVTVKNKVTVTEMRIYNADGEDITGQTIELTEGDTYQLNYKAFPEDASKPDSTWTVSGGAGVSVDTWSGLVTATKENENDYWPCTVRVSNTDNGWARADVTFVVHKKIVPIYSSSITLSPNQIRLTLDQDPFEVTVNKRPTNAEDEALTWTSSDESIAKVVDGRVIPLGVGSCVITAETEHGAIGKSKVIVTDPVADVPIRDLSITNGPSTMKVGESYTMEYLSLPVQASTAGLTWSSSDPSIVSIDPSTGKVTALAEGMSTITVASPNGLSASYDITVSGYAETGNGSGTGGGSGSGIGSGSGTSTGNGTEGGGQTIFASASGDQVLAQTMPAVSDTDSGIASQDTGQGGGGGDGSSLYEVDQTAQNTVHTVFDIILLILLAALIAFGIYLWYRKHRKEEDEGE